MPKKFPAATDVRSTGQRQLDSVYVIQTCSLLLTHSLAHSLSSEPLLIFVEPVELKFDAFQQLEPQYLSLAIYDLKERRRVTENFYVDVNDYDARQMVRRPTPGSSTSGTRAIFQLVQPTPDMYLVIRAEKTLMGDIETATEPYYKVGVRLSHSLSRLLGITVCSLDWYRSNPKPKPSSR